MNREFILELELRFSKGSLDSGLIRLEQPNTVELWSAGTGRQRVNGRQQQLLCCGKRESS